MVKRIGKSVIKWKNMIGTNHYVKISTLRYTLHLYVFSAVVEGRGSARGEIGLASIDALCSELHLWEFIDSASYARLRIQFQIQEPVEVLHTTISVLFNKLLLK